jgi:hypothetical protein
VEQKLEHLAGIETMLQQKPGFSVEVFGENRTRKSASFSWEKMSFVLGEAKLH